METYRNYGLLYFKNILNKEKSLQTKWYNKLALHLFGSFLIAIAWTNTSDIYKIGFIFLHKTVIAAINLMKSILYWRTQKGCLKETKTITEWLLKKQTLMETMWNQFLPNLTLDVRVNRSLIIILFNLSSISQVMYP